MRSPRSRASSEATTFSSFLGSGFTTDLSAGIFNRYADQIAPLGPTAIVVADLRKAQQVAQHEPGVAAALADAAIGDHIVVGTQLVVFDVELLQFGCVFER